MSQLKDDFKAAIDAFNQCTTAADYDNLSVFLDPNARMDEANPPYRSHRPRTEVIGYLRNTQPRFQPRFYPDYNQMQENPNPSDTATAASASGPAFYLDCSTGDPAGDPNKHPVRYSYKFIRPDTNSHWLITVASVNPAP